MRDPTGRARGVGAEALVHPVRHDRDARRVRAEHVDELAARPLRHGDRERRAAREGGQQRALVGDVAAPVPLRVAQGGGVVDDDDVAAAGGQRRQVRGRVD
jgi:hypothetical protein